MGSCCTPDHGCSTGTDGTDGTDGAGGTAVAGGLVTVTTGAAPDDAAIAAAVDDAATS
ncbi:hypothetical protein [Streptomyces bikiniensis]|uniref:hypothetical protein n=1 Tax=Streptomyces bikiniensis TaxID=1896 RepID=UPI000B03EE27|nr:hypothetical protein [Streptomyces bikiniensis]